MFFNTKDLRDKEIYLRLYKTSNEDKEKEYLPAYYFKILKTDNATEVGKCDLRIGHNDNIKYGGNIGYEIYEPYRGNRLASKACKLLLLLAKKHQMDTVYITCSPKNTASRKTCEYSGAVLVGIIDVPSSHELFKTGQKKTCQYVIKI